MRRKLMVALISLNSLLGVALLAGVADSQIIPRMIRDCCEGVGPEAYCCESCCWFVKDCDNDEDCTITQSGITP